MRLVVVVELHRAAWRGDGDVVAAGDSVEAVVLVPGVVERRLVLIVPGRDGPRPLPHVVGCVVREVGPRAGRIPVARAADLRLEVAGDGHVAGGRRVAGGDRA